MARLRPAQHPLVGDRPEAEIAVRLRRQRRLAEVPPLALHEIIDESALLRSHCGSEELEHILTVGRLANVAVQVIPREVGSHSGLAGNFTVVSFPDPAEPDMAYVEYSFGSLQIEKDQEVRAARLMFEHLADLALDQEDSAALIKEMIARQ
nr:DUF5753 domain-containing protein [Amycolatopsis sp. FDAARGOS 1241]